MSAGARVTRIDTTSKHAASLDGVFLVQEDAGDRQVSFLMGEAEDEIRAANGLCTAKYRADVVTEGLSYERLAPGARLRIGECTFLITTAGKRCFDECVLRAAGQRCRLPQSCAYARVLVGGRTAAGDAIEIL